MLAFLVRESADGRVDSLSTPRRTTTLFAKTMTEIVNAKPAQDVSGYKMMRGRGVSRGAGRRSARWRGPPGRPLARAPSFQRPRGAGPRRA